MEGRASATINEMSQLLHALRKAENVVAACLSKFTASEEKGPTSAADQARQRIKKDTRARHARRYGTAEKAKKPSPRNLPISPVPPALKDAVSGLVSAGNVFRVAIAAVFDGTPKRHSVKEHRDTLFLAEQVLCHGTEHLGTGSAA